MFSSSAIARMIRLLRGLRLCAAPCALIWVSAAAMPSHAQDQAAPAGRAWKEVRIASEGARPPLNFINAENELDGFEIDLGRALCARMKVTCTFVTQDWDSLIDGLRKNQYDAIMSDMEITDARLEKISFSKAYLHMPSAFVSARKRQIRGATPEDLAGRTIGVAAGSPHQAFLDDLYTKSTVQTYENNAAAILDLAEGRIDAVLGEKDELTDFLQKRYEAKCCKLLADIPRDPSYFGEGIGIGVRQQDTDLKTMFDKALDEITADGTYAKIAAKYYSFPVR